MDTPERLHALNLLLTHARRSDFHRARLPPGPLASWADFRRLPFMTREHLAALPPEGLVCVPEHELAQYHESSATSGAPVSVWYGRADLEAIHSHLSGWGVGFGPEDRVLVRFPYALSTIGHFVQGAAQRRGASVIPADSRTSITPLARVVELLRRVRVTVLATIPLGAVMIAEAAEMRGLVPSRDFPALRALCCAGEPLTPSRRRLLERLWGVPVHDNYGMTETGPVAMDCAHGRLHPWTEHFVCEVLDARLEREVAPGETGHLVLTSLTPRASPVIRYLTGDRVQHSARACACGATTSLRVRGRWADCLWVRGKSLDLCALERLVERLPEHRFWKVALDRGVLRFVVERARDGAPLVLESPGVRVELVPRGTLYDRGEPVSFGMPGKPRYVYPASELSSLVPSASTHPGPSQPRGGTSTREGPQESRS